MSDKGEHRPIKDWMETFSDIYSESDSKRTPEQIWIAIMAHASTIGESIRNVSFEKLIDSAAHTFCWLCSFINKCKTLENDIFYLQESVCGIISLKYPGRCGHCQASPCRCDAPELESIENKKADYKRLLEYRKPDLLAYENYTVDNYLEMFKNIYGGRIHIQPLETIGFHFLEEVGEAAFAVRRLSQLRNICTNPDTEIELDFINQLSKVEEIVDKYENYMIEEIVMSSREPAMLKARVVEAKMGLVIEISDTFSWFCAIINKLNAIMCTILNDPDKAIELPPLEEKLIQLYLDSDGNPKCPTCGAKPCNCAFYSE